MAKYRDEDWLRRKYINERLSTSEIGDLCGVTRETIRRWLHRHDIDVRAQSEATKIEWEGADKRREEIGKLFSNYHRTLHPFFFTDYEGYERAGSSDGRGGSTFAKIHRLLAIANGSDPNEIYTDKVVHHKNRIPWDNRPENIEVMTASEHSRHHAIEQDKQPPKWWLEG